MSTVRVRVPLRLLAVLALAACAGADAGDPLADAPAVDGSDRSADTASVADEGAPARVVGAEPEVGAAADETDAGVVAALEEAAVESPDGVGTGPPPVRIPDERPVFERPEHVRGIYLNKWTAGSSRRVEQLLALAGRTEVNAFVIDLKDATGYLSYPSAVPLAREIGANGKVSIHDLPGLLRRLSEEGVWPIARIVIVKDPLLSAAHPGFAVQDTAGGPWVDGNGSTWMNPWSPEVREYHLALAREAAALGFPEIQWDYVRFPDAPSSELARAVFPGRDGRDKADAVRAFLGAADEALDELGVANTADVFGVTTSARDVGIGQIWERFIDQVDVALPMVYPSHYYRGSFGYPRPNAHPYEIVREALERGLARSEGIEDAGAIRPWLQDFSLGEPDYGAPEVLAQIQAAYDLGIEEWLLWNPGSRYTEAALRPAAGWQEEPLIRVADRHVPLSDRHEALRIGELPAAETSAGEELLEVEVTPRPLPPPRILPRDSLRPGLDTLDPLPDSLQPRDTLPGGCRQASRSHEARRPARVLRPPTPARTGAREAGRRGPPAPGAPRGCPARAAPRGA